MKNDTHLPTTNRISRIKINFDEIPPLYHYIYFNSSFFHSSWYFLSSYWYVFVLILLLTGIFFEKMTRSKNGTHLPTTSRSSRIKNKLWWTTSSLYLSLCTQRLSVILTHFVPPLILFSPSFVLFRSKIYKAEMDKKQNKHTNNLDTPTALLLSLILTE